MEFDRRRVLAGLAATAALPFLSGCRELIEAVADSCPSDPAESGGVTWTPDVGHPVFWGFQNVTTQQDPPRSARIYYPTHEGFTDGPPILKLCLNRFPVVLFLHGQPPRDVSFTDYHLKWFQLPAVLARCGYVVVVPNHAAQFPNDTSDPAVAAAMRDVEFVRTQWADREWVDKQITSTVVIGHSFGALLGGLLCTANPQIGAFVSLGGGFINFSSPLPVLQAIPQPSFYMWADGTGPEIPNENLDATAKLWDKLSVNRYAAVYRGEHFDYLRATDTGGAVRGPCGRVGGVAADLVALFISRFVKPALSRTVVPVGLTAPSVNLTPEQEFFAGAHLQGLPAFQGGAGCRLDLRWNVDGASGSRRLGP